jgi:hypothetical protein
MNAVVEILKQLQAGQISADYVSKDDRRKSVDEQRRKSIDTNSPR